MDVTIDTRIDDIRNENQYGISLDSAAEEIGNITLYSICIIIFLLIK